MSQKTEAETLLRLAVDELAGWSAFIPTQLMLKFRVLPGLLARDLALAIETGRRQGHREVLPQAMAQLGPGEPTRSLTHGEEETLERIVNTLREDAYSDGWQDGVRAAAQVARERGRHGTAVAISSLEPAK